MNSTRKKLALVLTRTPNYVLLVVCFLAASTTLHFASGDDNLVKSGGPGQPFIKVVGDDIEEVSSFEQDDYDGGADAGFPSEPIRTEWRSVATKANQLVPPYAEIEPEYKRVCIYPNWSILRESEMAKIYPEDLDASLCTHIHYAYANIDVRTFQLTPSQFQDFNRGEHGEPLYDRVLKLRQTNPNLKILISIGGWFAKSTPFNRILASDTSRSTFIQNALHFLRHWQFDGLDIQWEYPGAIEYGATIDSKEKFTALLKYINKAFKDEYKATYKRYLLSAFVPSDETRIDAGYQVKLVCKYLDYLSVATYDYTGPYDSKTGYNSPLYSRSLVQNSANSSIHFWIDRGCPAKKLLLGIPTYARAFKIVKKLNTPNLLYLGIDSEPFVSPSLYTSEEGILSYYEVCELMSSKESKIYWDDLAEVPFAIVATNNETDSETIQSNLWISYEDARSARKKAEYVKRMSLGGVSIWSLDMDDFKGLFCNLGSFPIMDSVRQELENKLTVITEESLGITTQDKKLTDIHEITRATKASATTQKNPSKVSSNANKPTNQNNANQIKPSVYHTTTKFARGGVTGSPALNASYDNALNKLKKFKAIREIKIVACLDKRFCNLRNSSPDQQRRGARLSSSLFAELALLIFVRLAFW